MAGDTFAPVGRMPVKLVPAGDGHYALATSDRQIHNTTLPTVAGGDRAELQIDSRARLIVTDGSRDLIQDSFEPDTSPQPIGISTPILGVTLYADENNTSPIWIGGQTLGPSARFPLRPGTHIVFPIDDLAKVYSYVDTPGQALYFVAVTP